MSLKYTHSPKNIFGFSAILLSISFDTRHRTGLHCQTFKHIINICQNFQLIIFFDCFFSMNAFGVTFWTEKITSQTQSKNECSSSSSNHQICEEFFVSTQNSLWQLLCLRSWIMVRCQQKMLMIWSSLVCLSFRPRRFLFPFFDWTESINLIITIIRKALVKIVSIDSCFGRSKCSFYPLFKMYSF